MYYVGVDIGGMSIKSGIVSSEGVILASSVIPTEKISPHAQLDKIAIDVLNLIEKSNIPKSQISGIGVGCPGAIQKGMGVVMSSSNLKWTDFPLKSILQEKTGLKVRVGNDADAATIGEVLFGNAKKYNNVVMITLGTGVGGGIVINKKLYEGTNGVVAELGHVTIRIGGIKCGCGRYGCYEQYASASALIRQTKEQMLKHSETSMWDYVGGDIEKVNGITPFACARQGDKIAKKVINKYVGYICEGLLDFCNIFRPDAFIIGGGISKEGDYLTDKIKRYLKRAHYGYESAPKTEVLTAGLKNNAGIIGASALIAEDDF